MKIDEYLNKSSVFEKSRLQEERTRGDTYRILVIAEFVIILILSLALTFDLSIKTVVPYVIQVDKSTGNQMYLTSLTDQEYTPSEAEDKFNIARYIKAREGYVYATLQNEYDLVNLMTNEKAAKDYQEIYEGVNARDAILGDQFIIEANIISISLQENNGEKSAIVRVELIKKDIETKTEDSKTVLINLNYHYNTREALDDDVRLLNPLGFMVDYYRIADEKQ